MDKRWNIVYLAVLAFLVLLIVVFYLITAYFK